jgi:hypothetical protein
MGERLRLWLLGIGVGCLVGIGVLTGLAAVYVANSVGPAQQSRDAQLKALRLLVECTTPPQERKPPEPNPKADDCYVRSQRAQAGILGEPKGPINTVAVAAAACGAAHPGDVPATLLCTKAAMRP